MNPIAKLLGRIGRSVLLAGIIGAQLSSAQNPTGDLGANRATLNNNCLRRSIPLTVLQNPDNIVLQPAQLQVRVENANASIVSLEQQSLSPRVILMLDTSGSMRSDLGPKWTNALLAAGMVLDAVPPDSPVALVTFAEQAQVSGFARREEIQQKLVSLETTKPAKRTAIYSAVELALKLLGQPQFGDVIFIVTDGGDDYGPDERRTAAEHLVARGVRAFAFVVRDPQGTPLYLQEQQAAQDFFNFVKQTGGVYINPPVSNTWVNSEQAREVVRELRRQIENPYRLELQLSAAPAKPTKLKISSIAKLKLAYPERIEPCAVLPGADRP